MQLKLIKIIFVHALFLLNKRENNRFKNLNDPISKFETFARAIFQSEDGRIFKSRRYSNGIRAGIGEIDRKEFLEDFIIR